MTSQMTPRIYGRPARTLLIAAAFGIGPAAVLVSPAGAQVPPTTAPAAAPAAAPASMRDLRQMLDDKDYANVVKQAGKMLALKGDAAGPISRFQVVMLKGEGQAGMKLSAAAVDTFKSAAKETNDPREIALAYWTAELFKRSNALTYIPKSILPGGQRPDPISLLDLSLRTEAFQALLDDQLALLEPRIKSAATSQNIPAIMPVLEQITQLNRLDDIANGNDDRTAKVATELLKHSKGLMINVIKTMWSREGDIETAANKTIPVNQPQQINGQWVTVTGTKKTGLTRDVIAELHNTIDTCTKVHEASSAFLEMAKTDDGWSALINDSDRVAAKAADLLAADYSPVTPDPTYNNNNNNNGLVPGTVYPNGTMVGPDGTIIQYNGNNNTFLPGTSYPGNNTPAKTPNQPAPTTPGSTTPAKPTTPSSPTPATPAAPSYPGNPTPSNPPAESKPKPGRFH
jgi:hypothetical protein